MISNDKKKIKAVLLAMNHDYPNDVFVLNGLGLESYKNNDYEDSILYLERSSNIDFKSRNTIDILILNYQICSEYSKLDHLIKRAVRQKLIDKGEYNKEHALNYLVMAQECYQQNDLKNYHKYSEIAFNKECEHQYIFNNYIKSSLLKDKDTKAIHLIVKYWEKFAHPQLREYLFELLKDRSPKYQLKIIRELIVNNSYNVESFVIFGHFAKANSDLHDEAIKHLEKAVNIAKIKEVIDLLIEIQSKYYPDTDSEIVKLKKAKEHIACEYKYLCSQCSQEHEHWHLICTKCQSADQINIALENKNKVSLLEHS